MNRSQLRTRLEKHTLMAKREAEANRFGLTLQPRESGAAIWHGPHNEQDQFWLDLPIEEWARLQVGYDDDPADDAMWHADIAAVDDLPEDGFDLHGAYDGAPASHAELRMLLRRAAEYSNSRWWQKFDAMWSVIGRGERKSAYARDVGLSPMGAEMRVKSALRVLDLMAHATTDDRRM